MVGLITAGVTRVQPQNLMTVFDGPLVLTHSRFRPCKKPEHKHIVGIHLVGAPSIPERFGIAIYLATQQNAEPSQRVAKRIRTVQFDRTRSVQCQVDVPLPPDTGWEPAFTIESCAGSR